MAQGDVEQQQVLENNYKLGRMNGDDVHHQKQQMKPRRDARPRGPRGVTTDFPLRIVVPAEMVGAIIGRQGSTIHQITQETRARVDIDRKNDVNTVEKTIFVYGMPDNCTEACKRILYVIKYEVENSTKRTSIPVLKIIAHNNLIGRLIGKGGCTIKQIMHDTNTKVNVSSMSDINSFNWERIISVKADSIEAAVAAEAQISTKLRESYETDLQNFNPQPPMFTGMNRMPMYPQNNYGMSPYGYPMMSSPMQAMPPHYANGRNQEETTFLYIHKSSVGGIIGTKGGYIRNIIRYSGASIKIAPLDTEGVDQMERKVTIIGNAEAQWKAQFLIYEKVREAGYIPGNEDVRLKVEVTVPTAFIGRIIGKRGQNIKELQRVTGALVKIPKMEDADTKETTAIRIIGSFFGAQSAQRRIRSLFNHINSQNGHVPSKSVSPTTENHQQHQ